MKTSVYLLAVAALSQLGAPAWVEPVFNGAPLLIAIPLARFVGGRTKVRFR